MREGTLLIFTLIQQIVTTLDSFIWNTESGISFLDVIIALGCVLIITGAIFSPYITPENAWNIVESRMKK